MFEKFQLNILLCAIIVLLQSAKKIDLIGSEKKTSSEHNFFYLHVF